MGFALLSEDSSDIGAREIFPDVQKAASVFLCYVVREAITEIQGSGVMPFAPPMIDLGDASRGSGRYAYDVERKAIDQGCHFVGNIARRSEPQPR